MIPHSIFSRISKRKPALRLVQTVVGLLAALAVGVLAAGQFPGLRPGEADDVILRLLTEHTHTMVAGVLGAAIMACVMASDSQILALCTMFTEDVFAEAKKLIGVGAFCIGTNQIDLNAALVRGMPLSDYVSETIWAPMSRWVSWSKISLK